MLRQKTQHGTASIYPDRRMYESKQNQLFTIHAYKRQESCTLNLYGSCYAISAAAKKHSLATTKMSGQVCVASKTTALHTGTQSVSNGKRHGTEIAPHSNLSHRDIESVCEETNIDE